MWSISLLSPDYIHGKSQGLLHTVRLPLVGQKKSFYWIDLYLHWQTNGENLCQKKIVATFCQQTCFSFSPPHLGQLDGFVELVQGALQIRELLKTTSNGQCRSNMRSNQRLIFVFQTTKTQSRVSLSFVPALRTSAAPQPASPCEAVKQRKVTLVA